TFQQRHQLGQRSGWNRWMHDQDVVGAGELDDRQEIGVQPEIEVGIRAGAAVDGKAIDKIVWPSAGCLGTSAAPIVPMAPTLFSTNTYQRSLHHFISPSDSRGWIGRYDHPTAGHLATTKRYDSAERNDTFRSAERCLRLKILALRGETLGWNDWKRSEDWSGDYGCCRPCRQTRLLRCMKSISQRASPSRVCCVF